MRNPCLNIMKSMIEILTMFLYCLCIFGPKGRVTTCLENLEVSEFDNCQGFY